MSRVLLAWELGAHHGHLMKLGVIAGQLRAADHEVLIAVRDLKGAAEVLGPRGLAFAQAPVFNRPTRIPVAPASHAEMLALEGFADEPSVWGRVRGWISLLRLFNAEAIVADHAPGALVAGRILGLARIQVGTGFEIPPKRVPIPSIRPWQDISERRLARSERQVVDPLNRVLRSFGGREFETLAELFDTEARILTTFPELDPFGPRSEERYVGPIFEDSFGERVIWPAGDQARIFVYMRRDVPGAEHILRALMAADATTICFFPDIGPALRQELDSPRLQISTHPVRLESMLPQADLVLTYGGHGLICAAMLAGVPLLLTPRNVEQYLHATRLESAGLAVIMRDVRDSSAVAEYLERTLMTTSLKSRAQAFAAGHAGFAPGRAVGEIVEIIRNAIRTRTAQSGRPAVLES